MLDIVIEGFRGLAASWVFLFHLGPPAGSKALAALADMGLLGVPMFFVISGYCIGGSACVSVRQGAPAAAFLRRRLWRIYPPLWASMLVVLALPYLLEALSALRTRHFATPAPAWLSYSLFDWLGIATLGRAFFSDGQAIEVPFSTFNSVYWTLAIEVQFYLVMYVALLLAKRADSFLMAVTAAACALAFVPAAYCTGIFLPYWPLFAVGLALHRLIGVGATPANVFGRHAALLAWVGMVGLMMGFTLLLLAGTIERAYATHPHTTFFLFGLSFAVFLWFAQNLERFLARVLAFGPAPARVPIRLALGLGAASYSIYLLHGKLYALPAMLTRQILPIGGIANLVVTMGLTLVLACLFSIVVERRFARRRQRAAPTAPEFAVAPTGVAD